MNSANFHDYLKNPSMLHQVSYQELKSLAMQYPYATNLRYLVLIKSLLDDNVDRERNLTLASLSSFDRKKLQQLVLKFQPAEEVHESFSLEEDFLELKDLSALEDVPAEVEEPAAEMAVEPPTLEDAIFEMGETKSDTPEFDDTEDFSFLDALLNDEKALTGESAGDEEGVAVSGKEEEVTELTLEELLEKKADTPVLEELDDEEIEEDDISIEDILTQTDDLSLQEGEPASEGENENKDEVEESVESLEDIPREASPEEKKSESASDTLEDLESTPAPAKASWLNRVKAPQKGFILDDLSDLPSEGKTPKKKKKSPKPKKKNAAKKVASKSLLEDSNIATETLAKLLERQGYYEKAIDMYEQLRKKFPDRSEFFGDKIEALKKLM